MLKQLLFGWVWRPIQNFHEVYFSRDSHYIGAALDYYTVLAWWLLDCHWGVRHASWMIGLSKYRMGKPCLHWIMDWLQCILSSHDCWEFPLFFKCQWQSPCTACRQSCAQRLWNCLLLPPIWFQPWSIVDTNHWQGDKLNGYLTRWGWDNMAAVLQTISLEINFPEWKLLYFDSNFIEPCSEGSMSQFLFRSDFVKLLIHPKLQWCNLWSLEMDKLFHHILYNGCNYLSILGLKSIYVKKKGPLLVDLIHYSTFKTFCSWKHDNRNCILTATNLWMFINRSLNSVEKRFLGMFFINHGTSWVQPALRLI